MLADMFQLEHEGKKCILYHYQKSGCIACDSFLLCYVYIIAKWQLMVNHKKTLLGRVFDVFSAEFTQQQVQCLQTH